MTHLCLHMSGRTLILCLVPRCPDPQGLQVYLGHQAHHHWLTCLHLTGGEITVLCGVTAVIAVLMSVQGTADQKASGMSHRRSCLGRPEILACCLNLLACHFHHHLTVIPIAALHLMSG